MARWWMALAALAACSSDEPKRTTPDLGDTGLSRSTLSTPSSSSSSPTPTPGSTDSGPTRLPVATADTSDPVSTGSRTVCADSELPAVTPPATVLTEPITGCPSATHRTELVDPMGAVSLPTAPLRPGSGVCVYETLSTELSSDPYAEVPETMHLRAFDLSSGASLGTVSVARTSPADGVESFGLPGLCDPAVGTTLLSACDGAWFAPAGVSLVPGLASVTSDPAQVAVSVQWADTVDEVWVWVLLPSHDVALGPWPGGAEGDDWVARLAWGDLGVVQGDDQVQFGVLGCEGGAPVHARVLP
jgi:hypothetical protein